MFERDQIELDLFGLLNEGRKIMEEEDVDPQDKDHYQRRMDRIEERVRVLREWLQKELQRYHFSNAFSRLMLLLFYLCACQTEAKMVKMHPTWSNDNLETTIIVTYHYHHKQHHTPLSSFSIVILLSFQAVQHLHHTDQTAPRKAS